jgi:hypothetical protein
MEDNSMEQMINRNEMDEVVRWNNLTDVKKTVESKEDSEELFMVAEIEAI